VANVSDLYDFEFILEYDTNVLNGLGVIVIPFDNETSFDLQFTLNDTAGRIWVKVQYYPPAQPLTTIEPNTIVKLFFQVQSYGATPLHFSQTKLSNPLNQPIKHIAHDGYVSVLRRDVAILNISPESTEAYKGWIIKVNITASNLGDISEAFNITLYVNGHIVGVEQVASLAPKTNITITIAFDTKLPWVQPCHNYTIKAEASQVPYEIDIINNVLTDGDVHVKIMGDINGDKIVNYTDAILMGAAFGSQPGDPNWNPNADLNKDGYINYKDVIILGTNFGATCQ
jgi:archaellum component FlaF (FlaF/FlaG flagellin family)